MDEDIKEIISEDFDDPRRIYLDGTRVVTRPKKGSESPQRHRRACQDRKYEEKIKNHRTLGIVPFPKGFWLATSRVFLVSW